MALKTTLAALAFLGGAVLAQQDPAHPWPDHEPPADYYCTVAKDGDAVNTDMHACACLGMLNERLCGETEEEMEQRINSSQCKSWCREKQCMCRANCQDS